MSYTLFMLVFSDAWNEYRAFFFASKGMCEKKA